MKRSASLGSVVVAVVAIASLAACSGGPKKAAKIRVGSKNFSEQVLLGEVVAQGLEARGVAVDRKLNLGGTFVCHSALLAKELDLYPEYTGTASIAILHETPQPDPAAVRRRVEEEYRRRWKLEWGPPLGFENTFALVVRGEDAKRLGMAKISDLAAHPELKPGFGYEFVERKDGYRGLVEKYGLAFAARPAEMDLGLLYPALQAHRVDVVAGNSTDGLISAMGGVVLEDDRRYFPPYDAAFVVRGEIERDRPEVRDVLAALAGKLDAPRMRRFNEELDRDKKRPEDVAKEVWAEVGKR